MKNLQPGIVFAYYNFNWFGDGNEQEKMIVSPEIPGKMTEASQIETSYK